MLTLDLFLAVDINTTAFKGAVICIFLHDYKEKFKMKQIKNKKKRKLIIVKNAE